MAVADHDIGPPSWANDLHEDPSQLFIPGPIISDGDEFGTLISATVADDYVSRMKCSAVFIRILPISARPADELREIVRHISETIDNPAILKYIGVWNLSHNETWLVSEKRKVVSVGSLLASIKTADMELIIAHIAKKSLQALAVLKEQYHQPHMDLRPGNVYFGEHGTLCFVDVGIYHVLHRVLSSRQSLPGIKLWPLPNQGTSYSSLYSADLWDLGITLLMIAEGGSAVAGLWRAGKRTPRLVNTSRWSDHFSNFLTLLFQRADEGNAHLDEILQHHFVSDSSPSACKAVMEETSVSQDELKQGQYIQDCIGTLFRQNDVVVRVPLISIDDISTDHFSYECWTGGEDNRPTVELSIMRVLKSCKQEPLPKTAEERRRVAHTIETLEMFLETAEMA